MTFASEDARTAATIMLVEHASATSVSALRAAGIRSIILKGPVQQSWLSPAGPPRESIDVDLLVDPADVQSAGAVLAAEGYRHQPEVTPGVDSHSELWAMPERVAVELHWTLAETDPSVTWRVLSRESETTILSGTELEIPNEAARCLIVGLHAAQHGYDLKGVLYDLERAVVVAPRRAWSRAAELAEEVGAGTAFAHGLGLIPEGAELRGELGLETTALTPRSALSVEGHVPGAAGFYWLAEQQGPRQRFAYLWHKVFPPAAFMRFKHPYARRGRLQLAVVYLYRPLWIVRWAIPGFLAWRRSRRAAATARSQDRTR